MHKIILRGIEARNAIERGIATVSESVACTLGPKGRNVIIQGQSGPIVTKDGVTVAKSIELECPYENLGAQLCRQVSSKTNDVAGDGTTTATVLANAIAREGLRYVTAGGSPISLKRGIDKAVDAVVEIIAGMAKPIENKEEVNFVATISGNEQEVGDIVADAMEAVGKDGVITIEESRGRETTMTVVEGMRFDKGFLSNIFANIPEKMQTKFQDPLYLLYDGKLSDAHALYEFINKFPECAKKPLVIIADNIEGEALQFLVLNVYQGKKQWVAIKTPGFSTQKKDMLHDIAVLTGSKVISTDLGTTLADADESYFGSSKSIIVTKDSTTIIEGIGTEADIEDRILRIKATLETCESDYEARVLNGRMAKLSGGVAVIRVGASTEAELIEKKYRYEDALAATRAAVEEGIVPGGGVTLLRASRKLNLKLADEDENIGVKIVKRALEEPIRRIASNAGYSADVVVADVLRTKDGKGLDARSGKIVNMLEKGIIDPAKVTRSALQNAASIAGLVLTTETLIVDKPVESEKVLVSEGMMN